MIPTPSQIKSKQAEEKKNQPQSKGSGIPTAQQQEQLMVKCSEALGLYKDGCPMIVATTGFNKIACDYVRDELENAGWKVEKARRDGEFVFLITSN